MVLGRACAAIGSASQQGAWQKPQPQLSPDWASSQQLLVCPSWHLGTTVRVLSLRAALGLSHPLLIRRFARGGTYRRLPLGPTGEPRHGSPTWYLGPSRSSGRPRQGRARQGEAAGASRCRWGTLEEYGVLRLLVRGQDRPRRRIILVRVEVERSTGTGAEVHPCEERWVCARSICMRMRPMRRARVVVVVSARVCSVFT